MAFLRWVSVLMLQLLTAMMLLAWSQRPALAEDEPDVPLQEALSHPDEPFPRPKGLFGCPKGSLGCHVQRDGNASQNGDGTGWAVDLRPKHCCCQAPRRCWNGKACVVCPGSLTTWRATVGMQVDMLLIGILGTPRLTALLLHSEGALLEMPTAPYAGALSRWWLEPLGAADAHDWLLSPQLSGLLWWVLCPHWPLTVPFLPLAADSFWWVLALVHASLMHWLTDLGLLASFLLSRRRFEEQLQSYTVTGAVNLLLALGIYGMYCLAPSLGAMLADMLLRLSCTWWALDACSKPVRALWVMRDHWVVANIFAAVHLALLMTLISVSNGQHISFDALTLMLLVGPGSLFFIRFYEGVLAEHVQACIIIDKGRILDSSAEALGRLNPSALRSGLPHVTYVDTGTSLSAEDGVDAGGLGRDWLNRVAAEAFDPASGLVDLAVVDGTPYARLKPGADLRHLEAAGKVLGLALRAGQPLGVDLCAPLAHLLAHPNLPSALAAISTGLRTPASLERAEEEELPMADFSVKGLPDTPGLSGWFRFRHRNAMKQRFRAIAELMRVGFSRDWLRWVSSDEYAYWRQCLTGDQPVGERARNVRALGLEAADGGAVTLRNVREHMARRALDVLVVDVRKETEALWRGLHSIPGVPLPQLPREVRGSKRLRSAIEEDDAAAELPAGGAGRAAKRRRLAAGEAGNGPLQDTAHPSASSGQARKRRREGEQAGTENRPAAGPSEEPPAKRPRGRQDDEEGEEEEDGQLQPSPMQVLLSGNRDVPVEDWKRLTTLDYGSEVGPVQDARTGVLTALREPSRRAVQTLEWFWAYVERLEPKERADLLEWITGYRRLPAGGFPPPVRQMTIALVDSDQHLPVAHTCSLQLDLPAGYVSAETLAAKLSEASTQRSFHVA